MIGCAALLAAAVVPALALAAPPTDTVTLDDVWDVRADGENNLAAFINISREALCTPEQVAAETAFAQWIADGAVGEPPQDYPEVFPAVPVVLTVQQVTATNLRALGSATVPVELWTFEEGKSWDAGNLLGPCIDTDGVVDLTGEAIAPGELLASGEGDFLIRDNDFFQGGPRTNIWGETLSAEVSGPDGDYSYTFVGKNQARGGEYVKGAARFHLRAL